MQSQSSSSSKKRQSVANLEITPSEIDSNNPLPEGAIRVVSGSGFRYVVPFPWRLHELIEALEATGNDHIMSWLPDCESFKIHDPDLFAEEIVPRYFKSSSLKSFQRQLHLYGFKRVLDGADKGAYYHPDFVKGDRQRTHQIARTKAPKKPPVRSNNSSKSQTAKTTTKRAASTSSSSRKSSSRSNRRKTSSSSNNNSNNSMDMMTMSQGVDGGFNTPSSFAYDPSAPTSHPNLAPPTPVHSNSGNINSSSIHPEYCESFSFYDNENGSNNGGFYSNNTSSDAYDAGVAAEPRKIKATAPDITISDRATAWNACNNTSHYGKTCTDDIISLFGNIDGTDLTNDDLQDLLGVQEFGASSSSQDVYGAVPPQQQQGVSELVAHDDTDVDVATVVSQSSSNYSSKQTKKNSNSFELSSYPDMNMFSDADYPAEMDLLDDDKLTDDIISLLGTGF